MKAEPEQFRLNNFLRVQTKQLSLEYELKTRRSAKKKNKTKQNETKHQCDLIQPMLSAISLKFQPPSLGILSQIRTTR